MATSLRCDSCWGNHSGERKNESKGRKAMRAMSKRLHGDAAKQSDREIHAPPPQIDDQHRKCKIGGGAYFAFFLEFAHHSPRNTIRWGRSFLGIVRGLWSPKQGEPSPRWHYKIGEITCVARNLRCASLRFALQRCGALRPWLGWLSCVDGSSEDGHSGCCLIETLLRFSEFNLAHRNRRDFCDLQLRCPSQTPI